MQGNLEPEKDFVGAVARSAESVGKRVLVLMAALSVAALIYYQWKGYIPEFHSDSAIKNLLAEESVRSGTYFPQDWNYVNGDLWVLFGQMFVIPLLAFFRNGYALHAFSGSVSAVIVLLSVWCASGMAIRSRWIRLLVVTILAGGVSSLMAENLFGQVSYGNVLYMAALTLFFGWKFLEGDSARSRATWGLAFVVLTILTFWGNPQRAAAYDAVPMCIAVLAWALGRGDLLIWKPGARRWTLPPDVWRAVQLGMLLLLAAIIGSLLHAWSIAGVNNTEGAGSARWLSFAGFLANAGHTVRGMLAIFGGTLPEGQAVMSVGGVYHGLRFVAVGALLALIPVACMHFLRAVPAAERMFAAFAASSLCLFVGLQLTTTIPDMIDPVTSSRYMLPSLVLGLVLVAAYAERMALRNLSGLVAWGVLAVLLSSLISPTNPFSRMYREYGADPRLALVDSLKAQGLQYGYATYWNAGALSVLSSGDVLIRQVRMERNVPMPYRHLSSNRWYRPDAWEGSTFLMLTPEEALEVNWGRVYAHTGKPERELEVGGFLVKVFKSNIAAKIPGWDDQAPSRLDLLVPIDEYTSHSVGVVGDVPDGKHEIVAEAGQSGFLHYGPYVDIPAGNYRVAFDLEVIGDEGNAGYVDVVTQNGANVLAKVEIGPANRDQIVLYFGSRQTMTGSEFRVFSTGSSKVVLRRIAVAKVAALPPG